MIVLTPLPDDVLADSDWIRALNSALCFSALGRFPLESFLTVALTWPWPPSDWNYWRGSLCSRPSHTVVLVLDLISTGIVVAIGRCGLRRSLCCIVIQYQIVQLKDARK